MCIISSTFFSFITMVISIQPYPYKSHTVLASCIMHSSVYVDEGGLCLWEGGGWELCLWEGWGWELCLWEGGAELCLWEGGAELCLWEGGSVLCLWEGVGCCVCGRGEGRGVVFVGRGGEARGVVLQLCRDETS